MLRQLRVAAWLLCAALCTRVGEGLGATKGQTAADFLVLCRAKRAADEAVLAATGAAVRVARCRDALWQAEKEHVSDGSWDEVNTTNAAQLCATGSRPECDAWRWSAEAASGAAEVKKLAAEAVLAGADTEAREKATGELFKTTMGGSTSRNTGWGERNAGQCLASDMMWLCNSAGDGPAGTRWFLTGTDNAPCTPAGNLAKLGIDETSAPHRTHEWKEMKTGGSGADAANLATNWHIVKTVCDALIPVTSPQKNLEQKENTALGLVAGKLARAMEDFSKALHVDDDTTAANVHALGTTSSGQSGCTGTTGGSDSSACVGYDTILANTRDLTKIPWFAKLKQIEQKLASLAAVEQQCAAAERNAQHASERRKRHASQRAEETANEGMRKSAQGANTPAEKAQGTTRLDSKGGQTAASGDKTAARTGEACNEAHPRWHAGTRTCGDEANTATDNTVRTPNVLGSLATLATALAATTRKDVQAK
ncbi:variant surface glycoprotein (VSG), putative [Trypanosoma vivax Y486]|uniref:Variant surface glycoprotein (VSG), putative n=1 Tax=Trypanosoma vivax (strain Y486) TaxID=1055687 RepID=F9WLY1_TRYVY|nr:variant surface glycoprotein (VSG), putative [Trypanosoma vivax Y486]|eukprot:CCD18526.1 variant surface glycoprotein (VSG), putative [Trypanosoma vivax Y486]